MKKIFEMPEVNVEMFEEADILTLSPGDAIEFPEEQW